MMKEKIIEAIGRYNGSETVGIADWRLVSSDVSREEIYFIRDRIENSRLVEESVNSLTVYVDAVSDGKKVRGEATVSIPGSFSDAEIDAKVRFAALAASKSRNPWFALPGPAPALVTVPESTFSGMAPAARAEAARAALFAPNTEKHGRMNALELFIGSERRSFTNSAGQSFVSSNWKGYSEFVVDSEGSDDSGPVELFDSIGFSDPDHERLSGATRTRLKQVRDRAAAKPLPALADIPVILTGKEAEQVYEWFFGNSGAQAMFMKISPFTVGAQTQRSSDEESVADPFDLYAEAVLPGFAASAAFDPDGFPLQRTKVIDRGVLETLVGPVRYADWLGVPRKGNFHLFSVSPGTVSVTEMRSKPHLEPVMFSDFRLDPVTGDFGAEIRLAYWFDGEKRVPVTGGSISGAASEFRSTMVRSREIAPATRSIIPVAILLKGITVAGA